MQGEIQRGYTMPKRMTMSIKDYSGENTAASVYIADSVADLAGTANLRLAIENISRGRTQKSEYAEFAISQSGPATDEDANRELKVLIGYMDNLTGKTYTFTIPCVLASDFARVAGTDFVDIAAAPLAALVTAFEAVGASEFGNAVSVQYAKIVGRNN